ncbi:tetratricopeptide repeat protein [Actinophytocola sp.]|uniref:tetratricopeptide repeat protein n=1 Tax=Actinophytocola sp. TaxID=1872138 RepID=UPI002ED5BA41
MSQSEQQLLEKVAAAWRMPYGRAQTAAVEDVIRHADAQGFADAQYQARILAVSAYVYGGEPAKAFVPFAWCLATYDRGDADPRFDHNLYWAFKWMVSAMTKFPEVPLDRTHAVLDDMERRYRVAGHTMNPVHQHRERVARHVGDVAAAAEQYRLWCAAPRGEMSDCAGCEPTSKAYHLSWQRRDEDAVAVAVPVLDGSLTCVEQPQAILTSLLMPYLRTGRHTEAADAHRRAYRAIQANRADMETLATNLEFCAMSGNHARGLELVERHVGWLAEPPSPSADMGFSAAAALVLRRVMEVGHGDTPVRRPALDGDEVREVPVSALHEELAERARVLARRFDARNGTTAISDLIAETLAAEPIVEHLPLSGQARREVRPPQPAPVDLPESPADLLALVRAESRVGNHHVVAAVWRRFDEVCPDPEPALLAPRLVDRALHTIEEDPGEAEQIMLRAMELYEQVGDDVRRLVVRGHLGILRCEAGREAEGLADVEASAEGLMVVGDDEDRILGRVKLGYAYQLVGRVEEALAVFGAAVEEAERVGSAALAGQAAMCLAQTHARMGEEHAPAAVAYADQAVAAYATLEPCGDLRMAQFLAGQLHASGGDLDEAYPLFGEAAKAEAPELRGQALHLRGKVALDLGRAEEAGEALAGAIAALEAAGGPSAYAKVDFGAASLMSERADEAADALEEALAELPPDEEETNQARFLLARAYRALGQQDQALTLLEQVAEQCAKEGNEPGVGQMRAMSGDILDELDRDALAAEQYTLAAVAWHDFPLEELANRRKAAVSWRWAGDLDRCLPALAIADEVAAGIDGDEPHVVWEKASLSYDAARILADAGRLADAAPRAAEAAEGFRSLDATTESAFATVLHGRLLADLGHLAEAAGLLEAALRDLPEDATGPREDVESILAGIRARAE